MSKRSRHRRRHESHDAGGERPPRRHGEADLASAGQTVVSFTLRPVDEGGPWPLTRVLTALSEFDVERIDVARAIGDRHGIPLIHSQQLRWGKFDVFVEARHGRDGLDELSVELPPWDDVVAASVDEVAWRLLDTVAVASDARFGSVGDGEAPETELADGPTGLARQLRRHLALLVPEWTADDVQECGATVRRQLPDSGLLLVTG